MKKEQIVEMFERIGMDPGRRGETLINRRVREIIECLIEDFKKS